MSLQIQQILIGIGIVFMVLLLATKQVIPERIGPNGSVVIAPTETPPILDTHDVLTELLQDVSIDTTVINSTLLQQGIKNNNDTSKSEALKGTWLISYRLGAGSHTDKLVLNEVSHSAAGNSIAKGVVYLNQSARAMPISCGYAPTESSADSTEYSCLATIKTALLVYAFNFSENELSSAYLGVSESPAKAKMQIAQRAIPMTGFRLRSILPESYASRFDLIQWLKRGSDNQYCLDIIDDDGHIFSGLQAVQCSKDLMMFSPRDYMQNVAHKTLPKGFAFRWRVWSVTLDAQGKIQGQANYGGPGYEGRVIVE